MERCRSQAGRFQPSERCDMVWSWSEPPIEKTGTSVLQPWVVLAVCMTSEEALSPGSPEGEAAQQCLDVCTALSRGSAMLLWTWTHRGMGWSLAGVSSC